MRTLIIPKKKHRLYKQSKRGAMSGSGISGNKHSKRHLLAYGLPGTPNGVCIKKDGRKDCRCGGHSALAAA